MKRTVPIKLNRDFRRLYYRGQSASSGLLILYYRRNGGNGLRLGLTVSKKNGNAVTRNRIRRLIKENYTLKEPLICGGYDMVFVARPKAAEADFHKIGAAMDMMFKKSGLLK